MITRKARSIGQILHRCYQRHGISRLPDVEDDKPVKKKFKKYPIGYFHIDIAKVRTEEGKLYLLAAIDRTSKFAYIELLNKSDRKSDPVHRLPTTTLEIASHANSSSPCLPPIHRLNHRDRFFYRTYDSLFLISIV